MRTDQFAGLSPAAVLFLKDSRRPPRICPTCGHITETYIRKCATFEGMYNTEYELYEHPLKDGTYAQEFLQAQPWSSGPVHFLGLRLSDGTEITWTDEEIEAWL